MYIIFWVAVVVFCYLAIYIVNKYNKSFKSLRSTVSYLEKELAESKKINEINRQLIEQNRLLIEKNIKIIDSNSEKFDVNAVAADSD